MQCVLFRYLGGFAFFLVLMLLPSFSHGEEISLPFREIIALSLKYNHNMRAIEDLVEAEKSIVGIARGNFFPSLTFEERFMRTNNPTAVFSFKLNQQKFKEVDFDIQALNDPDAISDFQTSISFHQSVLDFKNLANLRRAKFDFKAAKQRLRSKREKLVFKVIDACLRIQAAQEFVHVKEKSLEEAREHLRIASLRFEQGLGLLSDKLRATTEVKNAERELVSAMKDLKTAKLMLGLLLGITEPVTSTDTIPRLELKSLEYYLENVPNREDVVSLEYKYKSAKEAVKLNQSQYIPILGVGGTYQLNDGDSPFGSDGSSWFLSAYMRWNIFDGGIREYKISQSKKIASSLKERVSGIRKLAIFEVKRAYLEVEEAKKNLELAVQALETAEEGARLVTKRYENSISPFVDLLNAQVNLNNARANVVVSRNKYDMSIVGLNLVSGTLFEELGISHMNSGVGSK